MQPQPWDVLRAPGCAGTSAPRALPQLRSHRKGSPNPGGPAQPGDGRGVRRGELGVCIPGLSGGRRFDGDLVQCRRTIPFSENLIILFDLAVFQELLLTAVERFASPLRGRGDYWLRLLPELNEALEQETQLAAAPLPHLLTPNSRAVPASPTDGFKSSLPTSLPRECTKLIVPNSKREKSKTEKDFWDWRQLHQPKTFQRC